MKVKYLNPVLQESINYNIEVLVTFIKFLKDRASKYLVLESKLGIYLVIIKINF